MPARCCPPPYLEAELVRDPVESSGPHKALGMAIGTGWMAAGKVPAPVEAVNLRWAIAHNVEMLLTGHTAWALLAVALLGLLAASCHVGPHRGRKSRAAGRRRKAGRASVEAHLDSTWKSEVGMKASGPCWSHTCCLR